MTIRHLRVFHTVCKHMSMTEAAKELYLTQSAVSQTVKELEAHYGQTLFDRFPRRIELTEAGKVLEEIASGILLSLNEIEPQLAMVGTGGTVRVGANLSVGTVLIHEYLNAFEQLRPDTKVELTVTRGSVLIPMLLENKLDLALMEDPGREQEFIVEPFYNDRIIFVGRPDCPAAKKKSVSLEEITKEDLLLRERGAGVRDQFEYIVKAHGINVHPAWESSSTTALVRAVMGGRGIAVVPYLLVEDYLKEGKLKEIHVRDVSLGRLLNIVRHRRKHLTPAVKDFTDVVRSCAENRK